MINLLQNNKHGVLMQYFKYITLFIITVSLTFLVGCDEEKPPKTVIPSYLSPEGKEVLNDAYNDLQECQSIQAVAMLGEVINLSDPVGYAAGQTGQSIGTRQPSLPVTDNVSTLISIDKICCQNIEKKINSFVLLRFQEGKPFTYQQNNFWRHLLRNVGTNGQCIPPKKPPKFLPGGRMHS